jgi:hypothetical protein
MPTPHNCPHCSHADAARIRFTAWGGLIGPRLLSLVKCAACGLQYNAKSGQPVEKAIRVYTTATLAVLIVLAAWMIYSFCADGTPEKSTHRSSPAPAGIIS